MSIDHTQQFLSLIEEVAEDGELTFAEIRKLAKWLNENKAARKVWPADQFFPLLKEVFADGKIEKAEAFHVAKLVQRVRREWARQNSLASPSVVEAFDKTEAKLPIISQGLPIPSFSRPDQIYEVEFEGPSCTCPDFAPNRSKLPKSHISRCCKHLMKGYSEIRPKEGWPSWLDSFFEAGFRPFPKQQWKVVTIEDCNYLISSAEPEWGKYLRKVWQRK